MPRAAAGSLSQQRLSLRVADGEKSSLLRATKPKVSWGTVTEFFVEVRGAPGKNLCQLSPWPRAFRIGARADRGGGTAPHPTTHLHSLSPRRRPLTRLTPRLGLLFDTMRPPLCLIMFADRAHGAKASAAAADVGDPDEAAAAAALRRRAGDVDARWVERANDAVAARQAAPRHVEPG